MAAAQIAMTFDAPTKPAKPAPTTAKAVSKKCPLCVSVTWRAGGEDPSHPWPQREIVGRRMAGRAPAVPCVELACGHVIPE